MLSHLSQGSDLSRLLTASALDCIIIMDARGEILEFNPAAERTFGYRRADAIGRQVADLLVPPILRERHRQGLTHYLATGEGPVLNRRIEVLALRADGTEFPVELAITANPDSEVPLFTAFLRDITERKRQEALIEEQTRLAAFGRDVGLTLNQSDTLPTMLRRCTEAMVQHLRGAFARIWTLDTGENVLVLRTSAGMYTHTDGPHGRVPVGQYKIGLIAQERRPHLTNSVVGDPRVNNQEWARQQGMVGFAGYPLMIEERVVGVMAMFARHPLSEATLDAMAYVANGIALGIERKQAEEDLRRARAELEQRVRERTAELAEANGELQRSNQELEQFASVASHDLQEPLRKIQAFGDRLQAKYAETLGEQGRDYLDRMRAAAARMSTLINDLLAFSRVTTRGQPFVLVDLTGVAQQVVSDLEGRIQQTDGRVEVGALPGLHADAMQMRQLLQNLIGNGLKFHKPGEPPVVQVEGRILADPGGQESGLCEITVRDNGIGFEEKYLDRIFQLFQRLHGRNEYEGTGIGLAICRKIVERHGGTIAAHSALGQGATFVVTLPLNPASEVLSEPEA